jgi:hypothetical protein
VPTPPQGVINPIVSGCLRRERCAADLVENVRSAYLRLGHPRPKASDEAHLDAIVKEAQEM